MKGKLISCGLAVAFLSNGLIAQSPAPSANNPILGVWRLNIEESTFDPGPAPTQPQTSVYVDHGNNGIAAHVFGVNAQGLPTYSLSVSRYDGTGVRNYNQTSLANFLATGEMSSAIQTYRIVDPYTTEITINVEGEMVWSATRTVSQDRRKMTQTINATTPEGEPVNNTLVYDVVCGDSELHQC